MHDSTEATGRLLLPQKRLAVKLPGLSSGPKESSASLKALSTTSEELNLTFQYLLQRPQKAVGTFPLNFVGHWIQPCCIWLAIHSQ